MATPKRGAGFGIVGIITGEDDELELTIFERRSRAALAVVRGSPAYLRRALVAVGLPPALVTSLGKNGDGPTVTPASRKPRIVAAKRTGEA